MSDVFQPSKMSRKELRVWIGQRRMALRGKPGWQTQATKKEIRLLERELATRPAE